MFKKCLFAVIAMALLAPAVTVSRAQEGVARKFTEEEVKAADAARLALSDENRALYNALRFLIRPGYEADLFEGRRYRPCPLPPMEEKSVLPMETVDHLRLWAVLQSGMPAGQGIENEIGRLLNGVRPRQSQPQLSALAIELGTLRAVWLRRDSTHEAAVKARAQELYKLSREQLAITGQKSMYVSPQHIYSQWFAGHMWRALILRCAHQMGIEVDTREWEEDLRTLMRAWNKDTGWTSWKQKMQYAQYDLHPNLMSICALSLAMGAPEKLLSKGLVTDLKRKLAECPDLLARLNKDYADEFTESRLLLVQSMGDLAPTGEDSAKWRDTLRRQGLAFAEPSGSFVGASGMQSDMALAMTGFKRSDRAAVETSMVILALSGGLLADGPGPLAQQTLANVGRTLHALSVWHASSAREQARDFAGRVNAAIADGCEYLVQIQLADGSFPGMHRNSIGNHGACVLTLLHGGWDRKHPAVQKGLEYILASRREQSGTYANAIVLMALQKYYEREQREHGLLSAETPAAFETARAKVNGAMSEAHRKLVDELLAELEGARAVKGGYGYTGAGGRTSARPSGSYCDNSCSQYAMLGFKSASMLGARVNSSVFSDEANRLLGLYVPDRAAKEIEYVYEPDPKDGDDSDRKTKSRQQKRSGKIVPGGWGYSPEYRDSQSLQMTAAGISSLTVCMDELKVRGKLGNDLAWKIALHVHGAQHQMAATYYKPEDFASDGRSPLERSSDGWGGFYNLYSVERACLLANLRKIGAAEIDWYRIGAEGLLDAQFEDGSWDGAMGSLPGKQDKAVLTINTCMAILFLKQAAMPVITEHKKRDKERQEQEQPPQTPKSPITPGPEDKKKPAQPESPQEGK